MVNTPSNSTDQALQDRFNQEVAVELEATKVLLAEVIQAIKDSPTYVEFKQKVDK